MARLNGGVRDGFGTEVPPNRQAARSNSRSQPSERPSCRFNCHPRFTLPCQHRKPADECKECKECKGISAAANGNDPALCAVPPFNTTHFASSRQQPPSADATSAGSPPRASLKTTNTFLQTWMDVWCLKATSTVNPSALLAPPLSETTPTAPSTTSQPSDSDGTGSRSSSACGSHLNNLLQSGSPSSLLSAASATSSSHCAHTEVQLLASQLADAKERNAELEARVASLSRANTLLQHQLQELHDLRTSLSVDNCRLRREAAELQERAEELEDSVWDKVAELERMDAASRQLAHEAEQLKNKLDQLQATARASPTTSPPPTTSQPTTSLLMRALAARGTITKAMEQLFCGYTGVTDFEEQLKRISTNPAEPNPDPRVELMHARTRTTTSGKVLLQAGTPSTWLLWKDGREQALSNTRNSSEQQQQQQVAGTSIPTHYLKVTPFHSSQRIQELKQGTFSPASTGSGRLSSTLLPLAEAARQVATTTAMDRAARHCSPGGHGGPFVAPLQWFTRPCSQAGGPLDVGHDLELVEVYEYSTSGSAEGVVLRAAEAGLQGGEGGVKEAAAAGAKWALQAMGATLARVQEAHGKGCLVAELKPENVVYHHPSRSWKLRDCGTAVHCGPHGRVQGRGFLTSSSRHAAPEQTQKDQPPWHGPESDVWAVGRASNKLRWIIVEACRAAAERQYGADWQARVLKDMGEAGKRLRRLEAACLVQEPSGRATVQAARDILGA